MIIQNLVKFCLFILKIWRKHSFLRYGAKTKVLPCTSIKGHNSVVNLRKTKINITNVDLVNDNVCTKFGLNLSIHSQDMEQKPNTDVNQGCNSVENCRKTLIYNTKVDLVNDNVYIKFGQSVNSFSRY